MKPEKFFNFKTKIYFHFFFVFSFLKNCVKKINKNIDENVFMKSMSKNCKFIFIRLTFLPISFTSIRFLSREIL